MIVAIEKTAYEQHQFQGRRQIVALRLAEPAQGAGQTRIVITLEMVTDTVAIHQRAGDLGNKTPNDTVGLTMSRNRHFLDLCAEFRQHLNGTAYGGVDVRFRGRQAETFAQHAKTNSLKVTVERLRIWLYFDLSLPWVHRVSARDHFQHQRDVGDAAAQRSGVIEGWINADAAGVRHEPMGWLQSDHAAP